MIIRVTQQETLREAGADAFEGEMADYLAGYAPKLFELRGRAVFQAVVRTGIGRARELGFTCRGPIRLVLECMVTFGAGFDTDPLYPGIRASLAMPKESNEMDRAEAVYQSVRQYWAAVVGKDGCLFLPAIGRLRAFANRPVAAQGIDELLGDFKAAYPQRFDQATDAGMRRLIDRAASAVAATGLPRSGEPVAVMAALMFGFGHEVLNDPLYPWVRAALEDPQVPEPGDRVFRLRDRAVVYLDHVAKYWSRDAR